MSIEQAAAAEITRMRPPAGSVVAVSRNGTYEFSKPVRDEITLIAGLGVEGDVHAGVTVQHRSRVRDDPTQPNLRQVHLMRAELFDEIRADGFDVGPGQLGENVTTSGIDLLDLPCGTILRFGLGNTPVGRTLVDAAQMEADRTPQDAGHGPADAGRAPANAVPAAIAGVLEVATSARLDDATARAVAALVAAAERVGDDPRPAVVVTGLRNPCVQIDGFRPGLLKRVLWRDGNGNLVRMAGVMGVVLRGGPVRPGDLIEVELPPAPHRALDRI